MKSLRKFIAWVRRVDWFDVAWGVLIFTLLALLVFLVFGLIFSACTYHENETGIQFVEAVKFGDIDDHGTLFALDDGNLYAVDAQYIEQSGAQFLLKIDTHNTDDPTDDTVLSVWAAPVTR